MVLGSVVKPPSGSARPKNASAGPLTSDNYPMEPSISRLRVQDVLVFCVLGLLALGVVMVQSASFNVTGQVGFRWTTLATKHAVFVVLAVITFFLVGRMDHRKLAGQGWRNRVYWLLGLAILACIAVFVIGEERNGARRWIKLTPALGPLGVVTLQPSELAKWAVVIFLAWFLACRPDRVRDLVKGFGFALLPVGVICVLVVIEDLGTAALIALAALLILLAGRAKWWHLAMIVPPVLAAGYWFVRHKEYRWKRLTAFVDPWSDPQGDGYHMIQSLLSFATGGLAGKGLGNGIQKLGYLPEDTTDFIFSVICEETGLFGALLTITLYLGIIYVGWQVIRQNRDSFGRLLAFGVTAMISLQALINIAVATVSIPTKGLSLPLVSAGGSGLVITCAALGLLYSVARHEASAQPDDAPAPADPEAQPQLIGAS
jgi:cell division protein FtsW